MSVRQGVIEGKGLLRELRSPIQSIRILAQLGVPTPQIVFAQERIGVRIAGVQLDSFLEHLSCLGIFLLRESPVITQPTQIVVKSLQVVLLLDRKSTRLNSSHPSISYAVLCL